MTLPYEAFPREFGQAAGLGRAGGAKLVTTDGKWLIKDQKHLRAPSVTSSGCLRMSAPQQHEALWTEKAV